MKSINIKVWACAFVAAGIYSGNIQGAAAHSLLCNINNNHHTPIYPAYDTPSTGNKKLADPDNSPIHSNSKKAMPASGALMGPELVTGIAQKKEHRLHNYASEMGNVKEAAACNAWDQTICNVTDSGQDSVGQASVSSVNAAFTASGAIQVSWLALSGCCINYYEVELSADGRHFFEIGTVGTKTVNRSSDSTVVYEFLSPVYRTGAGIVFMLLLSGGRLGYGRNTKNRLITMGVAVAMAIGITVVYDTGGLLGQGFNNMIIRVVQVDADGAKKYSGAVKVMDS